MRYQIFIGETDDALCYFGTAETLQFALRKVAAINLAATCIQVVRIQPHPDDVYKQDTARLLEANANES